MKVLYHINDLHYNSAQTWIFKSWREGFEKSGHIITTAESYKDLANKIRDFKPDLIMTDLGMLRLPDDLETLRSAKLSGVKIAMWIHWPLAEEFAHMRNIFDTNDFATLFFGEREQIQEHFRNDTGHNYVCIPNSASDETHVLGEFNPHYEYDILYIGTRLPKKKWFEDNILAELRSNKNYKVLIAGLGWSKSDIFLRICRKVAVKLGFRNMADKLGRLLIRISEHDERDMYASAKICLNFHERAPEGSQPHYIVNQRTFKVPACGGFQLVDEVDAINKYFTVGQEIIMLPLDKKIWLDAIEFYLENAELRKAIQKKGHIKARNYHLASHRVDQLLNELGK
jgi:spore maturation protein CgeB